MQEIQHSQHVLDRLEAISRNVKEGNYHVALLFINQLITLFARRRMDISALQRQKAEVQELIRESEPPR